MDVRKVSKILCLSLRHKPELLKLNMDSEGWVNVNELIRRFNNYYNPDTYLNRNFLDKVVEENNKKRFAYSADGTKIRASQGHSINIDLNLPESVPEDMLYHGTAKRFLNGIMKEGLKKMDRQHVHLSDNLKTAYSVGSRHGEPIVLVVHAGTMHKNGFKFYKSENGVWLTDNVPKQYLDFAPIIAYTTGYGK